MTEIATFGTVYDRDSKPKRERTSKQCRQCANVIREEKLSCIFWRIPIGSDNYRVTYPFGQCAQFVPDTKPLTTPEKENGL